MGQRLIIKGADFSANGFKSINYKTVLYSNSEYSDSTPNFYIVGTGCPITQFKSGKLTIVFDATDVGTGANLIKGMLSSNAVRLLAGKQYSSGSAGVEPFTFKLQYSTGEYTGERDIYFGEHTLIIDDKTATLDGTNLPITTAQDPSNYLFASIGIFGKRSNYDKPEFKYKHIKLEQEGVVVADLRPALDEHNIGCLYDKVSGTYLYGVSGSVWVAE